MKTLFAANIALVQKDLGVITARLQSLENSGDIAQCRQDAQQSELDKLKQANLLMEGRIAVLEDTKRQRNLKIRVFFTEDVTDSEIPHYLRRLLSSILTPSKAKAIPLDNYFRIPKPAKAPDRAPSHPRRSFHLRYHEVVYRWGPSRKLSVLHDGKRVQLQHQSDAGNLFRTLELPTPEALLANSPDVGCEKCPTLLPESQNRGSRIRLRYRDSSNNPRTLTLLI
ncbi:Hypothetical predicted protein [Pelobates cultripes]|uniref:Uncharacterized protein n=1 Tax=Pelobates cultripes TaxID=61616 RepID=A0AAD1S173_PELCU|nr:Hypothetical predicted protein [Pelobates cultripes]